MIISVEQAECLVDLKNWSYDKAKMKLDAIEQAIRGYTNNNFQNRFKRAECGVMVRKVYGYVPGVNVGDTIQISESIFNDGLYVVKEIEDNFITVDRELIDEPHILVTKVEYPADVVECAMNLLAWELNNRGKVGIQSETLSRHSVTYFNMDGDNSVMGYPKSLMGALKPYMKARF